MDARPFNVDEADAISRRHSELLGEAAKLLRLAATLRAPFGMAPLDRQRLHVEPEPEPEDDLARFRRENPRALIRVAPIVADVLAGTVVAGPARPARV